jgi:hypothetical protein
MRNKANSINQYLTRYTLRFTQTQIDTKNTTSSTIGSAVHCTAVYVHLNTAHVGASLRRGLYPVPRSTPRALYSAPYVSDVPPLALALWVGGSRPQAAAAAQPCSHAGVTRPSLTCSTPMHAHPRACIACTLHSRTRQRTHPCMRTLVHALYAPCTLAHGSARTHARAPSCMHCMHLALSHAAAHALTLTWLMLIWFTVICK